MNNPAGGRVRRLQFRWRREGRQAETVDLRGAYAVSDVYAGSAVACVLPIPLLMFPNWTIHTARHRTHCSQFLLPYSRRPRRQNVVKCPSLSSVESAETVCHVTNNRLTSRLIVLPPAPRKRRPRHEAALSPTSRNIHWLVAAKTSFRYIPPKFKPQEGIGIANSQSPSWSEEAARCQSARRRCWNKIVAWTTARSVKTPACPRRAAWMAVFLELLPRLSTRLLSKTAGIHCLKRLPDKASARRDSGSL